MKQKDFCHKWNEIFLSEMSLSVFNVIVIQRTVFFQTGIVLLNQLAFVF